MSTRRPNPRLVKKHRNYTVEEVATLFHVHKNTVRAWLKAGLPTIDNRRPLLILGRELIAFLEERRRKNKRPCEPGEIYCVRCRAPKRPAGDMAEYKPRSVTVGDLIGICPTCDRMIYRRVNRTKLDEVRGTLDVSIPQAPSHIVESASPSVNSDLPKDAEIHDFAQPQ